MVGGKVAGLAVGVSLGEEFDSPGRALLGVAAEVVEGDVIASLGGRGGGAELDKRGGERDGVLLASGSFVVCVRGHVEAQGCEREVWCLGCA